MRLLLGLVFAALLTASTIAEPFDAQVWKFQTHWDLFLRHFWGCSPEDTNRRTCRGEMSTMDRKEWEAARKAAAELFDLNERK